MNLLIVDDEVLAIQGLVDDLPWEELQFDEVFTASGYAQAINLFRTKTVDVLLCDIEMPLKSGLELAAWAKEHYPATQCILLTCHDDFAFARQAIQLECVGYILKPADTYEVTEVLLKAIRKVRQHLQDSGQEQPPQSLSSRQSASVCEECDEEYIRSHSAHAVEKAETYIRLHLADSLTVDSIAAAAGMSATHISRLFKKKHDMTLIDYITEERIRLAMKLLKNESLPVSTVAMRSGYSNYSYFTKAFKKYTGKTPREYRQELL